MSLNLRQDEKIVVKVATHWSDYISSILFGFILFLMFLPGLYSNKSGHTLLTYTFIFIFCVIPLVFKVISNINKVFVITNQRVYLENGVLSKNTQDVSFQKINRVEMKQGFFQRLLGSGDIKILTSNDSPLLLKRIEQPNLFKNELFNIISIKSKNI